MKALAFSGGKDSMVCLHLVPVDLAIYVDTGYAYPETLELVEYAKTITKVHVVHSNRKAQNDTFGIPSDVVPVNWTYYGQRMTSPKPVMVQSYFDCCYSNIVRPLWDEAKKLGVTEMVFGERSSEGHKSISNDGDFVEGIKRLHPIEGWTETQVLTYLARKMKIPEHFYTVKHSSLDCFDCVAFKSDSADRVEWTKKHPEFYRAYSERLTALDGALKEGLNV